MTATVYSFPSGEIVERHLCAVPDPVEWSPDVAARTAWLLGPNRWDAPTVSTLDMFADFDPRPAA